MNKKPMPLSTLPAPTANLIHQVALVALFFGAAVVMMAAVALAWSSSLRDRDAAKRVAELGASNAQAEAEVAKARAEAAGASERASRAEADFKAAKQQTKLTTEAMQSTAPGREITGENAGLFINFVKTVAKGRVEVQAISSNEEAIRYATQVASMLRSAGYDVSQNFGSATLLGEPTAGVEMKIRSMEDQPAYAGTLQKGLEFIGIDTNGVLDPAAGDAVVIFVGSKP